MHRNPIISTGFRKPAEILVTLSSEDSKRGLPEEERERERERERDFLTLQSRNRPLVPCAALVTRPV